MWRSRRRTALLADMFGAAWVRCHPRDDRFRSAFGGLGRCRDRTWVRRQAESVGLSAEHALRLTARSLRRASPKAPLFYCEAIASVVAFRSRKLSRLRLRGSIKDNQYL